MAESECVVGRACAEQVLLKGKYFVDVACYIWVTGKALGLA